jgi:hypothetical protein
MWIIQDHESQHQNSQYERNKARQMWVWVVCVLTLLALLTLSACVDNSGAANTSTNSNSGAGGASNTNGVAAAQPTLAPEPNSYSETITVGIQPSGRAQNTTVPPLQFSFAKMGPDKRASFQLPSLGDVIYLEHAGQRYIEFPAKNAYAQLDEQTLGFKVPNISLMSPSDVIARLKEHTQYQSLGPADMDGHPATKYKFTRSVNTNTTAGAVDTDSTVFLDQATGLPLRAEIIGNTAGGSGARIMIEARNIDLSPAASLFELPAGFRKVTGQEMKEDLRTLAATLSLITAAIQAQTNPQQYASPSPMTAAESTPSTSSAPAASSAPGTTSTPRP